MRVRKRKNGDARLESCRGLLLPFDKENPEKLGLSMLFSDKKAFRLEIGCGKGAFMTQLAAQNPDIGFIAVEKVRDVLIVAAEKIKDAALANVRFLCCDAEYLGALFEPHSFERIYINFCDPWPKARHFKRRLTYRESLRRMAPLLTKNGWIEFKTDNRELFDFSAEEFRAAGFELRCVTYDLHESEWAADNIITEYEANFSAKGCKINRLEAFLPE